MFHRAILEMHTGSSIAGRGPTSYCVRIVYSSSARRTRDLIRRDVKLLGVVSPRANFIAPIPAKLLMLRYSFVPKPGVRGCPLFWPAHYVRPRSSVLGGHSRRNPYVCRVLTQSIGYPENPVELLGDENNARDEVASAIVVVGSCAVNLRIIMDVCFLSLSNLNRKTNFPQRKENHKLRLTVGSGQGQSDR